MKIIECLSGQKHEIPPLWIMRQAGRYLPEYRAVRQTTSDFISFCLNSEKAAEVTLQPIRRFDMDAAIIFSDILMINWAMRRNVEFISGKGPVMTPLENLRGLHIPDSAECAELFAPVADALKSVRGTLSDNKALIGFSGAPWTLMTYMVEGGSSRDFAESRKWLFDKPAETEALIEILSDQIVEFLSIQSDAGADILMLFDSWAGSVPASKREQTITKPHQTIISKLREKKGIDKPIISFPKGLADGLPGYCDSVDIQAVAVDHMTDISWVHKNIRSDIAIQGNLDPQCLVAGGDQMRCEIDMIMDSLKNRAHIFNLGHGIVPQTPPEHLAELVNYVRTVR